MERPNIFSVRELFILCALRNGIVEARNLEEYPWTWRHYRSVQHKMIDLYSYYNKKEREEKEKQFNEDAKKDFPVLESKLRTFILQETDFGFSLSDREEDLSWYHPPARALIDIDNWAYKGTFSLSVPLTKKEEYVLDACI